MKTPKPTLAPPDDYHVRGDVHVPGLDQARNIPSVIVRLWAVDGVKLHKIDFQFNRPVRGRWIASQHNEQTANVVASLHNQQILAGMNRS